MSYWNEIGTLYRRDSFTCNCLLFTHIFTIKRASIQSQRMSGIPLVISTHLLLFIISLSLLLNSSQSIVISLPVIYFVSFLFPWSVSAKQYNCVKISFTQINTLLILSKMVFQMQMHRIQIFTTRHFCKATRLSRLTLHLELQTSSVLCQMVLCKVDTRIANGHRDFCSSLKVKQ